MTKQNNKTLWVLLVIISIILLFNSGEKEAGETVSILSYDQTPSWSGNIEIINLDVSVLPNNNIEFDFFLRNIGVTSSTVLIEVQPMGSVGAKAFSIIRESATCEPSHPYNRHTLFTIAAGEYAHVPVVIYTQDMVNLGLGAYSFRAISGDACCNPGPCQATSPFFENYNEIAVIDYGAPCAGLGASCSSNSDCCSNICNAGICFSGCQDNDGDGYGQGTIRTTCTHPELDCNDGNPNINPGEDEICDNNIDDDCDGNTDAADSECGCEYSGWADYGCALRDDAICGDVLCDLGQQCQHQHKVYGDTHCPTDVYRCVYDSDCDKDCVADLGAACYPNQCNTYTSCDLPSPVGGKCDTGYCCVGSCGDPVLQCSSVAGASCKSNPCDSYVEPCGITTAECSEGKFCCSGTCADPPTYTCTANGGSCKSFACDSVPNCQSVTGTCPNDAPCCSGACQVVTYTCTGTTPSNSDLCTGDDQGLTQNTAKSLVASCTAGTKCEYICKPDYHIDGTICVPDAADCDTVCGAWSSCTNNIKTRDCGTRTDCSEETACTVSKWTDDCGGQCMAFIESCSKDSKGEYTHPDTGERYGCGISPMVYIIGAFIGFIIIMKVIGGKG